MSSKEVGVQESGDEKKIKIISSSKDSCKTYVFTNEDHTLGNSLRYALMRKYVSRSRARRRTHTQHTHTHFSPVRKSIFVDTPFLIPWNPR